MPENVLRLEDVTMQFGGVVAVNDLSLEVNSGEIVALIGPNGAGKNDGVQLRHRVYDPPTAGSAKINGTPIVANHPRSRM
jgi:branched-chain amino acid transport system ATP-binding protein